MLDKRGWSRAYIDGGKIIQSFLREGLITELTLTRIPILIGNGLALFGDLDDDIDLKHIKTQVFESGLVSSQYVVGQNVVDAS
jgi:dihydrofolate reductase